MYIGYKRMRILEKRGNFSKTSFSWLGERGFEPWRACFQFLHSFIFCFCF